MSQRLPSVPNLDHLKKQAKDVLRVSRHRGTRWRLADAQHALARGYGFPSWPDLKLHVESIRRQPGAAAQSVRRKQVDRPSLSNHSIAGTWIARPSIDTAHHSGSGNVVLDFELAEDILTLTQIAADPAGRDVATKLVIQIDGLDHPIPFGNDLTLQASWTDCRTLETIVKHGDQTVARGTYEVAADGRSLVVSTPDRLVVFERV